jgi:hypothetical protein
MTARTPSKHGLDRSPGPDLPAQAQPAREDQLVDAMMRLRRRHPRVFDALVTIMAHADAQTIDAVAELLNFALGVRADDLAPIALHERAGTHRGPL